MQGRIAQGQRIALLDDEIPAGRPVALIGLYHLPVFFGRAKKRIGMFIL